MKKLQPFRQRVEAARRAEFAAAAATRAAQRALIEEEVGSGLKRRKVRTQVAARARFASMFRSLTPPEWFMA
jgi:hypothetical protein